MVIINNIINDLNLTKNNLDPNQFKNHSLPLARIKKIMKLDDEVKVIF